MNTKRFLSLLMSIAMSLSLFATMASAAEFDDTGAETCICGLGCPGTCNTDASTDVTVTSDIDLSDALPAVAAFKDVPTTHGFYTAIMDCANKGITSGYSDGTFRPTNTVTRAQFCVMLARAFYSKEVAKNHFDEGRSQWYANPVWTIAYLGILKNTSFQNSYDLVSMMDAPISRYDMAQLMTNIMSKKGFSATAAQKTEAQKKISDYKSIPSANQDAVKNVFALGIITGYSDGSFGGAKAMNRGQACVVIYRMMQYTPATSTGSSDEYDDGKTKPTTTPSTGSGSTGTTTPSTPTTPSTSATETGKLTNGQAITEANVKALFTQLQSQYPKNTVLFTSYTAGNTGPVIKVTNNYRAYTGLSISATRGCASISAFFNDKVFGTNVTYRKVPLSQVKAGDIAIYLNDDGKAWHVSTVMGRMLAGSAELSMYGLPELAGGVYCLSGGEFNSQTKITSWYETY